MLHFKLSPCPLGYITITYLHKGAGWLVGNSLNLDEADESDENRYSII